MEDLRDNSFPSDVAELILDELEPIINEIKSKWRETGKSLGFEAAELSKFNCDDDEDRLLRQVITKWVEKSLGANMWPPLLDTLGERATSINVVNDLKDKHCRVVYNAASNMIQRHDGES